MGKRCGCFPTVKRAITCGSTVKRERKIRKSKKWFRNNRSIDTDSSVAENAPVVPAVHSPTEAVKLLEAENEQNTVHSPTEAVKLLEAENEQNRHAYTVAIATAAAAEAAVAAAQAAAEVVRLTAAPCNTGKTKEEIAAIKIQAVYRGYMARRALRALRGLVRLKSLVGGQSVKRQSTSTLKCMQTLARMQSEVRARRTRNSEASLAIQQLLQQKNERELQKFRESVGENWDDSTKSKEQLEADIQNRQEASTRRERALAYAYSHQQTWRNSTNSVEQLFMDPNNPHWGWSWLERWMAARPWENGSSVNTEPENERISIKSTTSRSVSVREDAKIHSPTAQKLGRPSNRQSPSTPISKITTKQKPQSPRTIVKDEDTKSVNSVQSDKGRRHSTAGSSVRDDESLASSPAVPSYMASTESARAKSRLQSPLGMEKGGTPDRTSVSSAKKRLSYTGSPAGPRRHSGPPKVDISPLKDITANS